MVDHKIGSLPVIEGDKLVGIITQADIFKVLVEALGGQEGGSRISLLLPEKGVCWQR
jgi:acetoin utilization protein AcuB